MGDAEYREKEWLRTEVMLAASLTDAERIRILRDLCRTVEAIQRGKTEDELRRDEQVRRELEEIPGRARYRALAEKVA